MRRQGHWKCTRCEADMRREEQRGCARDRSRQRPRRFSKQLTDVKMFGAVGDGSSAEPRQRDGFSTHH